MNENQNEHGYQRNLPDIREAVRSENWSGRRSRSIFWGTTLVALGLFFFLDQLDIFETVDLFTDWWPVVLIALGLYTGGDILTGVGVWLLIGELRLFGLSYSSGWPVILIVAGGGIIIRTLANSDRHSSRCGTRGLNGERR